MKTQKELFNESYQNIINFENGFRKHIEERLGDKVVVEFPYRNSTIYIYTKHLLAKKVDDKLYEPMARVKYASADNIVELSKEFKREKEAIKEVAKLYDEYKKSKV